MGSDISEPGIVRISCSEDGHDELHGVPLQKMAMFMVIATRIPDFTTLRIGCI
jgi:hypothetical protein